MERVNTTYIIIAAIVVFGLVAAVYVYNPKTPEPVPIVIQPIKIGFSGPLSPPGGYSAGHLALQGAKVAIQLLNDEGGVLGKDFELIIDDTQGDEEIGSAAVLKQITKDKVVAILGFQHSGVFLKAQEVAEEGKVPIFATHCSNTKITEKHLQYTFRDHAIDAARANVFANFVEEQGGTRVAGFFEDSDYGIGLMTEMNTRMEALGITFNPMVVERSLMDMTPQILQIIDWGPDMLIVDTRDVQQFLIFKTAFEQGLLPSVKNLIMAPTGTRSDLWWENTGEAGNYAVFCAYYHPTLPLSEFGQKFMAEYYRAYGEAPEYNALNTAGELYTIKQALELAGVADPVELQKALVSGTFISFTPVEFQYTEGEGAFWHQHTPSFVLCQFQEVDQPFENSIIIFPDELSTGEIVWP